MNLHSNKALFDQAVIMASKEMMINAAIIEKDYYVTYLLKTDCPKTGDYL